MDGRNHAAAYLEDRYLSSYFSGANDQKFPGEISSESRALDCRPCMPSQYSTDHAHATCSNTAARLLHAGQTLLCHRFAAKSESVIHSASVFILSPRGREWTGSPLGTCRPALFAHHRRKTRVGAVPTNPCRVEERHESNLAKINCQNYAATLFDQVRARVGCQPD